MKPETKAEGTQQEPTWDHFEHKPPVYKVIAAFPGNSDFPVGKEITFVPWNTFYWAHQIEDCKGKREWLVSFFDQYPQIFQPQQEQPAPVNKKETIKEAWLRGYDLGFKEGREAGIYDCDSEKANEDGQ